MVYRVFSSCSWSDRQHRHSAADASASAWQAARAPSEASTLGERRRALPWRCHCICAHNWSALIPPRSRKFYVGFAECIVSVGRKPIPHGRLPHAFMPSSPVHRALPSCPNCASCTVKTTWSACMATRR